MDVAEMDPIDVDSFAWPPELVDVGRHIRQVIVDVLNAVERDREGHRAQNAEAFFLAVCQLAHATPVPGQGESNLGEVFARMGLDPEVLRKVAARMIEGSSRA